MEEELCPFVCRQIMKFSRARILNWPFYSIIEVNRINQDEPADKKTQKIVASKNNIPHVRRPISKSNDLNMDLGHLMSCRSAEKYFSILQRNDEALGRTSR